ncbi:hypothetical protein Tco_0338820, partial [Tanacetum coccineum]
TESVPIGRSRKKRRMHKDEIVEQDLKKMVKGGKMSKKGTIMTCGKCGGNGHNSRGCTGLRDIQVKGKIRVVDQEMKEYHMRYYQPLVSHWDHKQVLGRTSHPVGSQATMNV